MSDREGPKRFVAYGPGFSGDYDTLVEARAVVRSNGDGAVFVRVDHRFTASEYAALRNGADVLRDAASRRKLTALVAAYTEDADTLRALAQS